MKIIELNNSPELVFESNNSREYLTVIIKKNTSFIYENSKDVMYNPSIKVYNKVLSVLKESQLTITEISRLLGYQSVPNSVKKAISKLLRDNKIIKRGKKYTLN